MKRVLVTGGYGFLGSHLVPRLQQEDVQPFIFRSTDYDLTNAEDARRLFDATRPELVFHLAAEVGGIRANQASPGRYWYANLAMGLNVLEQSRLHDVGKLVLVGTVCSYPKDTPTPFHEEALWDGYPEETNAPYGIAKKTLFVGAQAYREQCGLNTICLLPANLYGPGDNFDPQTSHVIPAIIRTMALARQQGESEIVLWGDGSATREFLYVRDCAQALMLAAQHCEDTKPVNLGSGHEIRISALAKLIADLSGYEGGIEWDNSRPNGQPRRTLSTSRAETSFGFQARTFLDKGLRETVDWYERQVRATA